MKLFDTHAHLLDERFDDDRAALCDALPAAGITLVLEACCDATDIGRIRALVAMYPHIYGSAGIHPHSANHATPEALRAVERALSEEKIVAVGEIGLDYHYDFAEHDVQKRAFADQIAIATAHRVPVIVHDREAHGDCLDILHAMRQTLTGVMHCFSGSYETARQCIDDGLYIAFGGALTFKNAGKRREIASKLPLDRLLLETDCPYMTPEPFRGTRNDPRRMLQTLEVLASVRPEPIEEIAAATYENGRRLFGI